MHSLAIVYELLISIEWITAERQRGNTRLNAVMRKRYTCLPTNCDFNSALCTDLWVAQCFGLRCAYSSEHTQHAPTHTHTHTYTHTYTHTLMV